MPSGGAPTSPQVAPDPSTSTAWRSTPGTPLVSRLASTPPPVSSRIASTGSTSLASITWVAPSSCASASRPGSTSTAMIGAQPQMTAPITADSPTPPAPKIASDEPGSGRRR